MPSQWSIDNPTIGVNVKRATYDILDARRRAEGKTWAAFLLGDLEQHDAGRTAARAEGQVAERKVANRELRDLRREHEEAMTAAHQQHALEMTAAAEQAQLDVNAAYQQGRAEADPTLQLQHQVDQLKLRRYEATFDAYENHGTNLDQAVDQVLAYIGDRLTDPWAGERHRKYVEATHELMRQFDQMLDTALRPMAEADEGWLDRHEREVRVKQEAAIARAERDAHTDRTRTSEFIGAQLEAAAADGGERARAELAPEFARLQAALDDALAKLADLGPVKEERDTARAELVALKQELVEAGWAGREEYVNAIMENLRKPLADRVPIASPHQLAEGVQETLARYRSRETDYREARAARAPHLP